MRNITVIEKNFKGYLILNWKTGTSRMVKRAVSAKLGQFEVAVQLDLTVVVPETPIPVAQGTIKLSSQEVSKLTLSALRDEEDEDE